MIVTLRALEPEDLEILYQWENDPKIWQSGHTLTPFSRFVLKQYLENSHLDIYQTKQLRFIIELIDPSKKKKSLLVLLIYLSLSLFTTAPEWEYLLPQKKTVKRVMVHKH